MKLIIWMLILTLLMGSCVTRRSCGRKFPYKESDSVSVFSNTVTLIRDTTIYVKIPGDTVFESVPVYEFSTLSDGLATSVAWIKDGKLNHRLNQKDTIIPFTIKGALSRSVTETRRFNNEKRIVYINNQSKWQIQKNLGRIILIISSYLLVKWLSKINLKKG